MLFTWFPHGGKKVKRVPGLTTRVIFSTYTVANVTRVAD